MSGYNPVQIQAEIIAELERIGVETICDRTGIDLETDVEAGWRCSTCGYRIGTATEPVSAGDLTQKIEVGLGEYIQAIRAFADEIRDYIADYPDAAALESLLQEPLPENAWSILADAAMRHGGCSDGAATSRLTARRTEAEAFGHL